MKMKHKSDLFKYITTDGNDVLVLKEDAPEWAEKEFKDLLHNLKVLYDSGSE